MAVWRALKWVESWVMQKAAWSEHMKVDLMVDLKEYPTAAMKELQTVDW